MSGIRFCFKAFLLLPLIIGCVRPDSESGDLVDCVNPFIGTGGHGHTYPGVSLPFGMVQLSPDTRLSGWDGCSGYHYSDDVIAGFSHTHLSGTGIPDYADVLIMPMVGKIRIQSRMDNPDSGYASRFRHQDESASPGRYSVLLEDDIRIELTATLRAGFHRIVFPDAQEAHILIDLEHRDPVIDSHIRIAGDSEIEGFRRSSSWANDQHVYFVIRFSKPFLRSALVLDDSAASGAEIRGKNVKAYVSYTPEPGETILVKVGISAVDIAGARANLDTEIPHWDFLRTASEAREVWHRSLGRVSVLGGTPEQRTVFATALYHAMLSPNLFIDCDGRYRGLDGKIHRAKDFDCYTVFSLWDTFRAAHPLFTLLEPGRTVHFIRTFLAHYRQAGRLPVWELAANETDCMIGYHAVPVIVDAVMKGIRDFDLDLAFEAMKASAEMDHFGLDAYKEFGYIPMEHESESVSRTLEYAYDDWCIAQMARLLGEEEDYLRYIRRAQSYRNLYDPSTGFMRARINGGWLEPFDPREVNFNYTEANAWQYTFFVPHDVQGLIRLMGGDRAFEKKLDRMFEEKSKTTGRQQADITGMIGQYAHGNEPSHHMAYLYSYAGVPWKTQDRVRRILETLYHEKPDGLCGNEDCGQMSAWYVFGAMGFYPVTPGIPAYVLGSPLFEEVSITLENGKRFILKAPGASKRNRYIQSARLNGIPLTRSYLLHGEILDGGELVLAMGSRPNRSWGSGKEDIPVSVIGEDPIVPVPYVEAEGRTFTDSLRIALGCILKDAVIRYELGGGMPDERSREYKDPFWIRESTSVRATAFHRSGISRTMAAEFLRRPKGRRMASQTAFSPQYAGGGEEGLIDLLRGGQNFRNGAWQGFEGIDFEAVIDLGSLVPVNRVAVGFLQDAGSWIFMPESMEVALSQDGKTFETAGLVRNDVPQNQSGAIVRDFEVRLQRRNARFVRIRARNAGPIPDWHPGRGGKAWIFVDECIID